MPVSKALRERTVNFVQTSGKLPMKPISYTVLPDFKLSDALTLQISRWGLIGQTGKQGIIVPFEPAIKRAKVASFQGVQQANRDQLAWVQFGLAMLGYLFHLVIDKAEHMDDNVFGGHNDSSCARVFLFFSLEHDLCDRLN